MMLNIHQYDLLVEYLPGNKQHIADELSRNFLEETEEEIFPEIVACLEIKQIEYINISP